MNWNEIGPGIVLVDNIGNGKKYIENIEGHVSAGRLSWVSDVNKEIDEDVDKKAMSTMYIQNIRRIGTKDPKKPTGRELLHEEIYDRFDKDFTLAYQKYIQTFRVPVTQKEDYEILKYNEGNFFIDHVDDSLFMARRVSVVYYFNDDYEGGELYFPQHGIEFQPVAGAAYFFPGDMNYTHGVRPVTAGNRFTSPFFWTIKKHTGEKQP